MNTDLERLARDTLAETLRNNTGSAREEAVNILVNDYAFQRAESVHAVNVAFDWFMDAYFD